MQAVTNIKARLENAIKELPGLKENEFGLETYG